MNIDTKYSIFWHYFSTGAYTIMSILFIVFSLIVFFGTINLPDITRLCLSLFGMLYAICDCVGSKVEYTAKLRGFIASYKNAVDAEKIKAAYENKVSYNEGNTKKWMMVNALRFWVISVCIIGCITVCLISPYLKTSVIIADWILDGLSVLSLSFVFISYMLKEMYDSKKEWLSSLQGRITNIRAAEKKVLHI